MRGGEKKREGRERDYARYVYTKTMTKTNKKKLPFLPHLFVFLWVSFVPFY